MKVIDLLNKIAKGEEVPKKLRLKNKLYKYLYYQYNDNTNINIYCIKISRSN